MAILGKVRFNMRGEWNTALSYAVDDIVTYKNRTYRCKSANSATTPPNATYWDLLASTFESMGAWDSGTAYSVGDVVYIDSAPTVSASWPRNLSATRPLQRAFATYICIQAHTNQAPPTTALGSNAYWQCMTEGMPKNCNRLGWRANRGAVPATGVYESGAAPGWTESAPLVNGATPTCRIPDSFESGGLGPQDAGVLNVPAFISRSGGYVTWGLSSSGSSGLGGNDASAEFAEMSFAFNEWYDGTLPTPDGEAPKVIQAIRSYDQHLVLFNNGEVYSWGYGAHGQNGSGNNNSIYFPVRVGNNNNTAVMRGKKAIRIACTNHGGSTASATAKYALMSDGTVYAWGYNGYGQLGIGNTTSQNVPQLMNIAGVSGTIVDIWAFGADYGVFYCLTNTGNMYSCGRNTHGQMGWNGVTQSATLGLVKAWGTTTTKLKKFIGTSRQDATTLAAIDASNQLWTWGYNGYGQCGNDTTTNITTGPAAISFNGTDVRNAWFAGGDYPSLYVTRTSSLQAYACGYNGYYNLGRSYTDANRSHASAGNSTTTWDTYRLQPMNVEASTTVPYYGTITNVVNVETWQSTNSHTAILLEQANGTKWCGGYNGYGHFGFGYSDAYLDRALSSAGNTTNKLFKRLRYIPPGVTEAELGCIPVGWTNAFGALWYDKYGMLYYSGYDDNAGFNMRSDHYTQAGSRLTWQPVISKLPGA